MDTARRGFLLGKKNTLPARRPPWSLVEEEFTRQCTRCGDCIAQCPVRILSIGDGGFPTVSFADAGCTLCGDCARACSSGAIAMADGGRPWSWTATIDARCLAREGVVCRSCGEACETGAIRFKPQPGGVSLPHLDASGCTGCGACLAPCPGGAITLQERPVAEPEVST